MFLKPQLAMPLIVYLIVTRRWKTVLLSATLLLCSAVAVFLLMGTQPFVDYVRIPQAIVNEPAMFNLDEHVTLLGIVYRLIPSADVNLLLKVSGLLYVAFLVKSAFVLERYKDDGKLALFLILPVCYFTSAYFQPYDLVLLLPTGFLIAYRLSLNLAEKTFLCALILCLSNPFYHMIWDSYEYSESARVNVFGFAFLFLVSWLEWRIRKERNGLFRLPRADQP